MPKLTLDLLSTPLWLQHVYLCTMLLDHNIFGVQLSRVVLRDAQWLDDNIIHISIPMQLISLTCDTYWCRKAMKTRQQHPSCFLRRFVLPLPQRFPKKSTKYRAESSKSAILSFTTNTLCKQSFYAFYFFRIHQSNLVEPSVPSKPQSCHMKSGCSKPLTNISRSCEQTWLAIQSRPESLGTPFFILK